MARTNSLINNLMSDSKQREPEVGDGATILMWTDRIAATIVGIERFKTGKRAGQVRAITVQDDRSKRIDSNGRSEMQDYEYSRDADGPKTRFTLTAKGTYEVKGGGRGLLVGSREEYHDFTF